MARELQVGVYIFSSDTREVGAVMAVTHLLIEVRHQGL